MNSDGLFYWIQERDSIRKKREAGKPKPWTNDPILQNWRFCNVYRELDTVTAWIREHWREPHAPDPDLWFAMTVARLVNWPDSLTEIGYPVPWNPAQFVSAMGSRGARGKKQFTGAYTIHADSVFQGTKAKYLAAKVLTPMWNDREKIRPRSGDTLASFNERVIDYRDMGTFMTGQVVADIKFVEPLRSASDWWTWATPGPGSQRGLNRVLGRDKDTTWPEGEWLRELKALQAQIDPLATKAGLDRISGQDLQNSLCEFDKWERVRLGEGKPRKRYPGKG